MGRYENGNYHRNEGDGELQWLEDGVGLLFSVAMVSVVLLFTGIFGLATGLFNLLFGTDQD